MPAWSFQSGQLALVEGDLTKAGTEAIVNAANPGLLGGGGVDGAIHKAAGPELLAACRDLIAKRGGPLPTGQAVITPGFRLDARFVIHTVGPVWRGGNAGEERLLRAAHAASLRLAKEQGLASIAFPAISCGAYGYPLELAAPVILSALRQGLEDGLVRRAELWLHGAGALHFWSGQAETLFGPPQSA